MGRLMPTFKKVYFDANIFINTIEQRFEKDICDALTGLLIKRSTMSPFVAACDLTLAETLVRPMREKDDTLIATFGNILINGPIVEVEPISRDLLYHAARLRADYPSLKLPDAIHLSAAFKMKCSHFLTSDTRINEIYHLQNFQYDLTRKGVEIVVIRPTLDIVNQLVEASD
jgi:predicted nucleic acid-binding protein